MNTLRSSSRVFGTLLALGAALFSTQCAYEDGGAYRGGMYGDAYGGPALNGFDGGYYEPWSVNYGGWGPNFRVGPYPRGGGPRAHIPEQRPPVHTYHPAPAGHPAPSLPAPRPGRGNKH